MQLGGDGKARGCVCLCVCVCCERRRGRKRKRERERETRKRKTRETGKERQIERETERKVSRERKEESKKAGEKQNKNEDENEKEKDKTQQIWHGLKKQNKIIKGVGLVAVEGTGWRRPTGCLISIGQFPQKIPVISGSFAKNHLQLKTSYGFSPPCSRERVGAKVGKSFL